jgi:predicted component of type VI protein secretion system
MGFYGLKCTNFPLEASVTQKPPELSEAIPIGNWKAVPSAHPSQTCVGFPLELKEITRHCSGSVTETLPAESTVMNGLFSNPLPYQPSTGHSEVAEYNSLVSSGVKTWTRWFQVSVT